MSFADLSKSLSDIERKVNKSIKILGKGNDMNYKDAIKLGTKSNSIVSTINKGIKDYSVSIRVPFVSVTRLLGLIPESITDLQPLRRRSQEASGTDEHHRRPD